MCQVLHICYISFKPYKKSQEGRVVLILQVRILKLSVRISDLPSQEQKMSEVPSWHTLWSLLVP